MSDSSRRQFLQTTIALSGGLFTAGAALAEVCGITPKQTEGPFYPVSKITDDSINDLSVIVGHSHRAKGEVVYVSGVVRDANCQPVAGALVEIWQAAASGRYNHPSDSSGLQLDPDFQGWGEYVTNADGRYAFKTVVPGHYPADVDWERPPHIHYKVTRRGYRELVTQLYFTANSFTGEMARLIQKLNDADLILQQVPGKETVIVEFAAIATTTILGSLLAYRQQSGTVKLVKVGDLTATSGEKVGNFDLTIRSAR